MIGPTIVFLVAASLVVAYILTVNRMLRTDENWSESNMPTVKPTPRTKTAAPSGKFAHA